MKKAKFHYQTADKSVDIYVEADNIKEADKLAEKEKKRMHITGRMHCIEWVRLPPIVPIEEEQQEELW